MKCLFCYTMYKKKANFIFLSFHCHLIPFQSTYKISLFDKLMLCIKVDQTYKCGIIFAEYNVIHKNIMITLVRFLYSIIFYFIFRIQKFNWAFCLILLCRNLPVLLFKRCMSPLFKSAVLQSKQFARSIFFSNISAYYQKA